MTAVQNVSINRIQLHAKDRVAILMLPRHMHAFYKEAERRGEAVVSGAQGSVLDPSTTVDHHVVERLAEIDELSVPASHWQGLSAKMGLDATRPVVYREHVFTKVRIPGEDEVDLDVEIDAAARVDFTAVSRS